MRRFITLLAASATSLFLTIASGGTVTTAAEEADPSPRIERLVEVKSAPAPRALLKYWTHRRLAAAARHGTYPIVRPPGRRRPASTQAGVAAPQGTVTALQPPYEVLPERAAGRIFFKDKEGNYGLCSGAVVTGGNESVVWTAAHCLHSFGKDFHRKFVFVPGYAGTGEPWAAPNASCPETVCPYGVWPFRVAIIPNAWRHGDNPRFDFGALVLSTKGEDETNDSVQDVVNSLPITFNAPLGIGTDISAYGYTLCEGKKCPDPNPYTGLIDFRCDSEIVGRDNGPWGPQESGNNPPGPPEIAIDCRTLEDPAPGAHSGGPWLNSDGDVISNYSYGFWSGDTKRRESFGPYLGRIAKQIYNLAEQK